MTKHDIEMATRSIAISLKRMELDRVVQLKTWCCMKGFKDFESSSWLALCDKERILEDELAALSL